MKHSISIKTVNGVLSVSDFKAQRVLKSEVIGVVLQTETIGLIISLDQWDEIWCSDENRKVFNKECGEAEALQTLSGLELTRNIVKQNEKDGENMTAAGSIRKATSSGIFQVCMSLERLSLIVMN